MILNISQLNTLHNRHTCRRERSWSENLYRMVDLLHCCSNWTCVIYAEHTISQIKCKKYEIYEILGMHVIFTTTFPFVFKSKQSPQPSPPGKAHSTTKPKDVQAQAVFATSDFKQRTSINFNWNAPEKPVQAIEKFF